MANIQQVSTLLARIYYINSDGKCKKYSNNIIIFESYWYWLVFLSAQHCQHLVDNII